MRISDWSSDVCSSDLALADGLDFKPIIDTRLRYENVDQDGIAEKADALTVRARAGFELGLSKDLSVLVEGEGTLALNEDYNSGVNLKTAFPIVADQIARESCGDRGCQSGYISVDGGTLK